MLNAICVTTSMNTKSNACYYVQHVFLFKRITHSTFRMTVMQQIIIMSRRYLKVRRFYPKNNIKKW